MSSVTNSNSSLNVSLLNNEQPSTANTPVGSKTNEVALSVAEQPVAQTPAAVVAQPKRSYCKKVSDNLDKIVFGIVVASITGLTQGFGLGNLF